MQVAETASGSSPPQRAAPARDRLLVAARDLLTELPVERITVRTIAARAGVGHALITRYYGSREGLLTIAIGATLITMADEIAAAPDIRVAVRDTFQSVLENARLAAAISTITTQSRAVEQSEGFPMVTALAAHLEVAGASPARARARAATIINMIFGWVGTESRWLRMGGHADPTTGRYDFLQTLLGVVDDTIDAD
jgi:AcrR family transcriptional regulator